MKQRLFLFTLFALRLFFSTEAQEGDENFPPPEIPLEIRAIKTQNSIRIDGKLDETDWSLAQEIADFFRTEPRQGGEIKYKTTVRVIYDDRKYSFY